MPYVERDNTGSIVAVSDKPSDTCTELVEPDSIELSDFFSQISGNAAGISATDPGFIRVVEDVIELLIEKQVILFTDLPTPAQNKMLTRKKLRNQLTGLLSDEN